MNVDVMERQTCELEVLVPRKGRAGSNPAIDTVFSMETSSSGRGHPLGKRAIM